MVDVLRSYGHNGLHHHNSQQVLEARLEQERQILEQHRLQCEEERLQCERQHNYEEAHEAKQKLLQLKEHDEYRRREEVRSQHLEDRLKIEEGHMEELQIFNEIWDRKVAEFEAHAGNLQRTLAQRHNQEFTSTMDKHQNQAASKEKFHESRDLLNLRKVQESQARRKDYEEARKTKDRADKLENQERNAWQKKWDSKLRAIKDKEENKQRLEMGGLQKRIVSGREEQKQIRKKELERILQRYHNGKMHLESHHTITTKRAELQCTDKYPFSPPARPNTSTSRPISKMSTRR